MEKLRAVRAFPYARRNMVPGEEFEAPEHDAKLLKAHGRAVSAADPIQPEAGSGGIYKRRDMVAKAPQGGAG